MTTKIIKENYKNLIVKYICVRKNIFVRRLAKASIRQDKQHHARVTMRTLLNINYIFTSVSIVLHKASVSKENFSYLASSLILSIFLLLFLNSIVHLHSFTSLLLF